MYIGRDSGEYYTCACGETTEHSYLLSSRDGFVGECCKRNGWDLFEYNGVLMTKKPTETVEQVKERHDRYVTLMGGVDWDKYHTDKEYQIEVSELLYG